MIENNTKKYMSKSDILELLYIYIQENDLQAGEKLPSERFLCELWNVSRSTLRAALHRLLVEDVIEANHGKGYYIKKQKIKRNLQDMKSLILCASEQNYRVETKVLRQEVISGNKRLSEIFKNKIKDPILELLRIRYIDGIPALLEYNYTDLTRCPELEKMDFENIPYYQALELRYQLLPHSGHQEISITKLREEEAALFSKPVGSAALYMSGMTFDKNDLKIPIEVFKSIAEPSIFCFSSHMKVLNKNKE